jgi:hypothetical protein
MEIEANWNTSRAVDAHSDQQTEGAMNLLAVDRRSFHGSFCHFCSVEQPFSVVLLSRCATGEESWRSRGSEGGRVASGWRKV